MLEKFVDISKKELASVTGGKHKKHRYIVYNNGMPTGRYIWR